MFPDIANITYSEAITHVLSIVVASFITLEHSFFTFALILTRLPLVTAVLPVPPGDENTQAVNHTYMALKPNSSINDFVTTDCHAFTYSKQNNSRHKIFSKKLWCLNRMTTV